MIFVKIFGSTLPTTRILGSIPNLSTNFAKKFILYIIFQPNVEFEIATMYFQVQREMGWKEGIGQDSDSDNDTWLCLASRWDSSGQVKAGNTATTFDLANIQPTPPAVGNILWHITLVLVLSFCPVAQIRPFPRSSMYDTNHYAYVWLMRFVLLLMCTTRRALFTSAAGLWHWRPYQSVVAAQRRRNHLKA